MSIATAIANAQQKVNNAYTAVSTKGGTLPVTQDLSNLPTAINSIPSSSPSTFLGLAADIWSGLKITSGVLEENAITTYEGTVPKLSGTLDFSAVTSIASFGVLRKKFKEQSALVGIVNFSNCQTITAHEVLEGAFQQTHITGLNFSGLTHITGDRIFKYCCFWDYYLTSIDFSNLEEINGENVFEACFNSCALVSVSFDKLETISGNRVFIDAFNSCSSLTTLSFPALTSVTGTNVFNEMLAYCDGVTVHFPATMQSTLGNDPDVLAGFGGTNTTVLFDL